MDGSMRDPASKTEWADAATLRHVRPVVRDLLLSSEAFAKLPAAERQALAKEMVKVSTYMANPDGLAERAFDADGDPLASAQADAVEAAGQRATEDRGFAGEDFEAGALKAGTRAFGDLISKVNFPDFVSGLIQGVFQAIVDSSIQQMRAYGELLANVAKSVDQFARDNITENNARDWLVQQFPDVLEIQKTTAGVGFAEGDTPTPEAARLAAKGDDLEGAMARISAAIQLTKPITDLADEVEERRLVTAAQLQIARGRQQLLASMVMLGINRIVITDGLINAKVLFDINASDQARRRATASLLDTDKSSTETEMEAGYGAWWFSPVKASLKNRSSTEHIATVQSAVDDTSESKADLKAKLSGEVRVNFKSDYLPMEKLATPKMIAAIQGNAAPADDAAAKPT
jgi:hypothetical protein